jgi:thymidylate kinase
MNIAFTGTHGVGKTTAAKMLEKILDEEIKESTISVLGSTTRRLRDSNNLDGNYSQYLQQGSFELACVYLRRTWLQEIESDFVISERWALDELCYLPAEAKGYYELVLRDEVLYEVENCWDVIYYLAIPDREIEDDGVRPVDERYQRLIDTRINSYLIPISKDNKIKVIPNNSMEEMEEYLRKEVEQWKSITKNQ